MSKHSGKLFGGIAGFFLGGPIGAILGVLAGSYFDQNMVLEEAEGRYYHPELVFWANISILAAKISKADGKVTQDEINVLYSFLAHNQVDNHIQKACGEAFNKAKEDGTDVSAYAKDIYQIYNHDRAILHQIFQMLLDVAKADGVIHENERRLLREISYQFGFTRNETEQFFSWTQVNDSDHLYTVLGVSKEATLDEIKQAYRKLVKEYHPDKLQSKGLPYRAIKDAETKMQEINSAYEKIVKMKSN